jgi:hypothetical protein
MSCKRVFNHYMRYDNPNASPLNRVGGSSRGSAIEGLSQVKATVSSKKTSMTMRIACWNMRCKFSIRRITKAIEDGRLDSLSLADTRAKNTSQETVQR